MHSLVLFSGTPGAAWHGHRHGHRPAGLALWVAHKRYLAVEQQAVLALMLCYVLTPLLSCCVSCAVAVCKDGKKVVCGSQSGVLALWSWGYWNDCSDRFPGHPESVDALVKFDEDTIITGSSDGLLRVLNILPNKLIGVLGEHADDMPVERLALSQDRAVLASMSHNSCVKLWDMSVLQDDSGEEGDSSSEWEEAGSEEAADGADAQAQQQDGAPATAAAQQGQTGREKGAAAAAAAGSDDSDSDSDSDEPQSGSKKRKAGKDSHAQGCGQAKVWRATSLQTCCNIVCMCQGLSCCYKQRQRLSRNKVLLERRYAAVHCNLQKEYAPAINDSHAPTCMRWHYET